MKSNQGLTVNNIMKVFCLLAISVSIFCWPKVAVAVKNESSLVTFQVPKGKVRTDSEILDRDVIRQGEKVIYTVDYEVAENEDGKSLPKNTDIYFEFRLPILKSLGFFDFDANMLKTNGLEVLSQSIYYADEAQQKVAGQALILKKSVTDGETGSLEVPIQTYDNENQTGSEFIIEPLFDVRMSEEIETSVSQFVKGKAITARAVSLSANNLIPFATENIEMGTQDPNDFIERTSLLILPIDESELEPVEIMSFDTTIETFRPQLDPVVFSDTGGSKISYSYTDWKTYRYIDIDSSTVTTPYTVYCKGATTIGFPGLTTSSDDRTGTGGKEGTVTVKYPIVGYFEGKKVGCIAKYTVSYRRSVPNANSPNKRNVVANNYPAIQIGDMLYKGIAMTNVDELQAEYQFFYAEDGEEVNQGDVVSLADSFYSIHSLNAEIDMSPSSVDDYYNHEGVRFIGDEGVTKTVVPSNSDNLKYTPNADGVYLSGVFLRDWRKLPGYRYFWGNSGVGFDDYIGSPNYYMNSVTAYQNGVFSFTINTPKNMNRMWWSISSGSIAFQKPDEPQKTVSNTGEEDTFVIENTADYGDTVTFRVEQQVNQLNVDSTNRYTNLKIVDTLPEGMECVDSSSIKLYRVYNDDVVELPSSAVIGTASVSGNKRTVTFEFNQNYLQKYDTSSSITNDLLRGMLLDGEIYRLEFKAQVIDTGSTEAIELVNSAQTFFNTDKFTPESNETITRMKAKEKSVKLHIRQAIREANQEVVLPNQGFHHSETAKGSKYFSLISPSTEETAEEVKQELFTLYTFGLRKDDLILELYTVIPEYYSLFGYTVTSDAAQIGQHVSTNTALLQEKTKIQLDYGDADEYWVTVFLDAYANSPGFYNWDYKLNEFGKVIS